MSRKHNRDYYNEFADWYENERHDGYHRMIDELETDLLRKYIKGKRVLEVGCGTGLIMRQIEREASHAVGLDISPGMLQRAVERGLDVVRNMSTGVPPQSATAGGGTFHPLTPQRILDTRTGNGAPPALVQRGATLDVAVSLLLANQTISAAGYIGFSKLVHPKI